MTGENDAISQFPEKCQTSTNFWAKFTRGMLKTKKVSSVKKEGIDKPKSGTASDVGGVISLTIVRKKQTDRRIVVSETGKQPDNWLSKSKIFSFYVPFGHSLFLPLYARKPENDFFIGKCSYFCPASGKQMVLHDISLGNKHNNEMNKHDVYWTRWFAGF